MSAGRWGGLARRCADRIKHTPPKVRAGVLSLVLPGLGHAYVGRFGRAAIWFAGLIVVNLALRGRVESAAAAVVALALNVASAVDAAVMAPPQVERR